MPLLAKSPAFVLVAMLLLATSLTPTERKLRAEAAAHSRWAKPDARRRQSQKISAARQRKHEEIVDPDDSLPLAERRQLAENSMRAEMALLALKSARARREARQASNDDGQP